MVMAVIRASMSPASSMRSGLASRGALCWGAPRVAGTMVVFTVPADTPGLAERFEGRIASQTEYKKRESFALPEAGGAAAVRFRFGSISSGRGYWGIDNVGLYEGSSDSGAGEGTVAVADPAALGDQELKRPANDAEELTNLAMEFAYGQKSTDGAAVDTAPVMATAMAAIAPRAPAPATSAGSANSSPRPWCQCHSGVHASSSHGRGDSNPRTARPGSPPR